MKMSLLLYFHKQVEKNEQNLYEIVIYKQHSILVLTEVKFYRIAL